MRILILRSIVFDDEIESELINRVMTCYKELGHEVFLYNMPACENVEHWAGYALLDNSSNADLMICVDFPTALIKHKHKRIILSKPLPIDKQFRQAIDQAFSEAIDYYQNGSNTLECPYMPDIEEYVQRGL